MADALTLAIDVGTGSMRAALVDGAGIILAIASREHEQIVPRYGWAEQRPADWWAGVAGAAHEVLAAVPGARERIEVIAACGQMHGTVLVDADGALTRQTAPLWNDKRTVDLVTRFEATYGPADYLARSGNPPTPAWPGFKLAWLRDHDASAYRRAATVLMPKDYINLRLTGARATDWTEASCFFLMDPSSRTWSAPMIRLLGLDADKLPAIGAPTDILGRVTAAAAADTGLREGTPVLVGGADFPVALLGSGVTRPGLASDVTGTSSIITVMADRPLIDPEVCNVAAVDAAWGAFVLLETGGDGMRWARRAFHDRALSYDAIVARAAEAPAGADGLFFLPFLTGERLGAHRNARAQFFGLAAGHGGAHLHRAVMEGVAFAVARQMRVMEAAAGRRIERVVASGGGSRTRLWLEIKASLYGVPIAVPEEAECGLVGCAILAAAATGRMSLAAAGDRFVRIATEVVPNPAWADTYARMQPIFDRLYVSSQAFYDDLDRLASAPAEARG